MSHFIKSSVVIWVAAGSQNTNESYLISFGSQGNRKERQRIQIVNKRKKLKKTLLRLKLLLLSKGSVLVARYSNKVVFSCTLINPAGYLPV